MDTVKQSFIDMWKRNLNNNNKRVCEDIESRLRAGYYFLINGRKVTINNAIRAQLEHYIQVSQNQSNRFNNLDAHNMKLKEYGDISILHQTPDLFIRSVLNSSVINLPLFSEKDRSVLMDRAGGGHNIEYELPEYAFDDPDNDYTLDHLYDDMFIKSVRTRHTLYLLFSIKHPELSKHQLCYIIDGISSLLFFYFNHMGESTHEAEFLATIVDQYDAGVFGRESLLEFENRYKAWVRKKDTNDPPIFDIGTRNMVEAYSGGKCRKTRKMIRKN